MDELIRAISADGFVRMSAVGTRSIAERARQIHKSLPVVTAAMGRTLAAASMMGAALKAPGGSVTIRINGGGPVGSIIAVSDSNGDVRGYVRSPMVSLPKRPDGKLNVGGAVGRDGLISVTQDIGVGEPYVGSTRLVSGEIAEDVAAYFLESQQTGAACSLGVLVDTDQSVLAAGGYIVELMPGAPEGALARLEKRIAEVGTVSSILKDNGPEALIHQVLRGFDPVILARQPVCYRCYCSRERVERALLSTGEKALTEMTAAGEGTVVACQFCDKRHKFTPGEITSLLDTAKSGG